MEHPRRVDPSTPIPPPPHSIGRRFAGLRSPIDPASIPSPVYVQEQDERLWSSGPFYTLSGQQPPLASTDYVVVDQGNSSPRFIRLTSYAMPHSSDVVSASGWPLGAVIQPMAPLHPGEDLIPLVTCGQGGPPRCARCQAYVNPFCEWVSGGQRWKCNLCGESTEVLPEYFCHLDSAGQRMDYAIRVELQRGTVDFAVSGAYYAVQPDASLLSFDSAQSKDQSDHRHRRGNSEKLGLPSFLPHRATPGLRPPAPVLYILAIETTHTAIASGFLSSVLSGVQSMLYGEAHPSSSSSGPTFPRGFGNRLAIMTFNSSLQFYELSSDLQRPRVLVVSDIDDAFVPMHDNVFVDPDQSRLQIEALLNMLSKPSPNVAREDGSAMGAVIEAFLPAVSESGAHMLVFATSMPNMGSGALSRRDEAEVLYTNAEKTLYAPRDAYWPNLAEKCALAGLAVDMFLAPYEPVDVASFGHLCHESGGQVFFHPKFQPARDEAILRSEIRQATETETCYDAAVRIRCSTGLRVSSCYGSFHATSPQTPAFAVLRPDTTFAATFAYTYSSLSGATAYLQCATLYTTRGGHRRVRCQNLAIDVKPLVGEYFARADVSAGVGLLSKIYLAEVGVRNIADIRKEATEKCAATLLAYRTHCSGASAQTQLILPEALKTLPMYTLCMLKGKAMKGEGHSAPSDYFLTSMDEGSSVTSDVRCNHRWKLLRAPIPELLVNLYPRLFALHDLQNDSLVPGADGLVQYPAPMRLSYLWMEAGGLYLMDNGEINVLWVGGAVVDIVLRDLFAVDDFLDVGPGPLPDLPTLLSTQVRNLLDFLTQQRGRVVPLLIARQNMDATELEFSNLLLEDENNDGMSYTDCEKLHKARNHLHSDIRADLCELHEGIRTIAKGGKGSWKSSW